MDKKRKKIKPENDPNEDLEQYLDLSLIDMAASHPEKDSGDALDMDLF